MPRLLIRDGYNLDFTVPARLGTPTITGKFRPALPDQVADYFFRSSRVVSGKDQVDVLVDFLAKHLISWDVTGDGAGGAEESVAIRPESLKRVPYPILQEIKEQIMAYGLGDPTPAERDAKN